MPYTVIEHTADVGLDLEGDSLELLLADAIKGLFHLIGTPPLPPGTQSQRWTCSGLDLEDLLVRLLAEALARWCIDGHYLAGPLAIVVHRDASGWQAEVDGAAHPLPRDLDLDLTEVKAVTYHRVQVLPPEDAAPADKWRGRVFFDL